MDDLQSAQRFDLVWEEWLTKVLGNSSSFDKEFGELQITLKWLIDAGVRVATWKDLAKQIDEKYDRINGGQPIVDDSDWRQTAQSTLDALVELEQLAKPDADPSDRLLVQLGTGIDVVKALLEQKGSAVDMARELNRFHAEGIKVDYTGGVGTAKNWQCPTKEVRDSYREIGVGFRRSIGISATLPLVSALQRRFAAEIPRQRKADGVAGFNDLLV